MYGADDNGGGNDRQAEFKITSTKLYVPIVTLSTKGNVIFFFNTYKYDLHVKRK